MKCILSIVTICSVILGCRTPFNNEPHVLKRNATWDHIINDPYSWSREQLAEATPIGADGRLRCLETDISHDGQPELLIHADVPASLFDILVFEKVSGGYRYLGSIAANPNWIISPKKNRIVTYQRCGGHNGAIVEYALTKNHFEVIHSSGLLDVGDGAPDENNKLLSDLFGNSNPTWQNVPNQALHGTQ